MSASKTWLIDSTTDYNAWTHSTATNVTASFDSTTTDADGTAPNGSIKYTLSTVSSGGACYSEISDTWQNWGVPAGTTVTKVAVTASWQCTAATKVGGSAAIGPFTLRDSTGALLDTILASQGFSGTSTWTDRTSGTYTLATPSPASTTVRLRIESNVSSASGGSASVILMVDWIRLTIYYRTPQTIAATSTNTAALGKVPGKLFAIASTLTTAYKRTTNKLITGLATLLPDSVLALTRGRTVAGASRLWLKRTAYARALRFSALLKAPAVNNYTQAIDAAATLTAAFVRSTGKKVAATVSNAVALIRQFPKTFAIGSTLTVAFKRSTAKIVAAGATLTAALVRSTTKTVAATTTLTTAFKRGMTKTMAVTSSMSASFQRAVGKVMALGATLSVLLGKGFSKVLSTVSMTLTTVLNAAATATRTYLKAMDAAVALSVSLSKVPNKLLATGASLSMRIERVTYKLVVSGAVFSVSLVRRMSKTFPVATTFAVTLGKAMGRTLQITLALGLSFSKLTYKVFALAASLATTLDKTVRKTLAVTASFVASLARNLAKRLSVVLTGTVAFIRSRLKSLTVTSSFAAVFAPSFIGVIRGLAQAVVSRLTYILTVVTRSAEATTTIEKVVKARGSADKES